MDVIVLVLSGLVLIATIAIPPIGIILERKGYNNGCCPECGTKLRLFDTDS